MKKNMPLQKYNSNPKSTELFNLNFQSLEVVSRSCALENLCPYLINVSGLKAYFTGYFTG